ncbi:hypothetical protein FRB90_012493 [Tulasnella sp. 427]|nr:hypothetical protein FRB90_012493 [Tulasnella sp. 427]
MSSCSAKDRLKIQLVLVIGLLRRKPPTMNIYDYCSCLKARYGSYSANNLQVTPETTGDAPSATTQPTKPPPAAKKKRQKAADNNEPKAKRKKPNTEKRLERDSEAGGSSRLETRLNEPKSNEVWAERSFQTEATAMSCDDPVPNTVFFRAMDILAKEKDVSIEDAKLLYKLGSCRATMRQSASAGTAEPGDPKFSFATSQVLLILGKILGSIISKARLASTFEGRGQTDSSQTQQQDLRTRLDALQVALFGLLEGAKAQSRSGSGETDKSENFGATLATVIIQPAMAAFTDISLRAVSQPNSTDPEHGPDGSALPLLYGVVAVVLEHSQLMDASTLWSIASGAASSGVREIQNLIRADLHAASPGSTEGLLSQEVPSPDSDRPDKWRAVRGDAIRLICSVLRLSFPIISRLASPSPTEANEDENSREITERETFRKGIAESIMELTMDGVSGAENEGVMQTPFRRLEDEEWFLILQMGELLLDP